ALEGVLWRQMNAVRRPIVESAICLIVADSRTAVVQNPLRSFDNFEYCPLFWGPFRNAFDLLCVEDGVHAMNKSMAAICVKLVGGLVSIAVIGANWFRCRTTSGFHLPELNLGSLLSLPNLPRQGRGLSVRHPTRIRVAAT